MTDEYRTADRPEAFQICSVRPVRARLGRVGVPRRPQWTRGEPDPSLWSRAVAGTGPSAIAGIGRLSDLRGSHHRGWLEPLAQGGRPERSKWAPRPGVREPPKTVQPN